MKILETCTQRLKQNKENTLRIPSSIKEFSRINIIEGQTKYKKNLAKCKSKAETDEKLISRNEFCSLFVKEESMFFRTFQPRQGDGRVFKQLLVPNKLNKVLKLAHYSIWSLEG